MKKYTGGGGEAPFISNLGTEMKMKDQFHVLVALPLKKEKPISTPVRGRSRSTDWGVQDHKEA
jgi:hypothetical protein